MAGLTGWALDDAWLRGFGRDSQPVHPLSALTYIGIALSLLAAMRGHRRLSRSLLAIPAMFVAGWTYQAISGSHIPYERWLFPHQMTQYAMANGPPYSVTVAIIAVLATATAISTRTDRAAGQTVIALASLTLGVAILGACIVYLGIFHVNPDGKVALLSAPASLQAMFISAALLLWRGRVGWFQLLRVEATSGRRLRTVLPIVILLPALTALAEITTEESGLLPPAIIDLVAAASNILIMSGLVFWSIARISAEHDALIEVTHAMDAAPIALTSPTGEIEHWSRGCEDLYGWTAVEAIGRRKYELLRTVDAQTRIPLRRGDDVQDSDREVVEHHRDGTPVHVVERVRRVEEMGRSPVYAHSMTNISARVAADLALQETEANLQLALASHQIGSFEWDVPSGRIIFSAGAEQRLGLRHGEIGEHAQWIDCVDPEDFAGMQRSIVLATEVQAERVSYQYRFYPPAGGMRSIEGSARFLYDEAGKFVRGLGVIIDVTDRVEREQALRVQEELFRSALATVPSAMIILDDQGLIKAFSASSEQMFGYTAEEVIGSHVKLLTPSAIRAKPDDFIPRYLATRKKRLAEGPRLLSAERRDGRLVPVELWLGESDGGKSHFFTAFCIDLSERYAAEERLSDMRAELLHVSRLSAMSEMATGLAHELNQPLAATVYFLGAADLVLADPTNSARGQAFVKMASEQALRAGAIIRRMREFITKAEVDTGAVEIVRVIDDAVALSFVGGAQSDIRLRYEFDPRATTVLADAIQIQQVLANLLRNAIEELRACAPDGREITIRTAQIDGDMIECSVSDTGPGLDPDVLAGLYKPFVSTKGEKGMGVGLSISRRIIEAHRGTFHAGNNPAGGAIFRFTLPKMDKATGETA
ncbi:PAS domain-containing sensor histidine kinase [Sphingomonas sp. HMP6]|uniref:PAS domain-containing sensor histidine kinase n=1 Tax=Sphingomonas sp. HMP6 TaxID=1517551 RepID=UPI001E408C73|nr:PAS domain-containing sensor histidine kinase [Sphingomonas sp. HMP6]